MNKMARKKKESTPGEKLAKQIIEQYNPKSVEDMQNALKDIFGPMFEAMLQGEMNGHLGYESNDHGSKSTANRRNGYISKKIKTSAGEVDIKVPRDRDASFEPKLVPKRKKDVSEIEAKVLAMYARGMSQRDIAETIEDIYGFEISHETISEITDCVLDELNDWQNRPLKKMYTFLFVDCMYVTIRKEYESKSYAVYTILGYDTNGEKDILGLWLNESESKHTWMQIFDELKARGVEDVLFIYVPSKDYKKFTQSLKKVYGAPSLNACKKAFEQFCQEWSQYPGAVDVWKRNFSHVEQLFDYGSAVRRVMYTTNAVESINSSFRKVTKKGAFPNESALLKVLYLRITELYKKWNGSKVQNWAMVRNQLVTDDKIKARIEKYEHMI